VRSRHEVGEMTSRHLGILNFPVCLLWFGHDSSGGEYHV
jgi:hypothetical protein